MTHPQYGSTTLIVNPISGRGRVRELLGEIERLLPNVTPAHRIELTTGPGDGLRLAREAALAGSAQIVAVGGDGTLHEVVNGVLTAGCAVPPVALIPAGRGSDFARGLSLPGSVEEALAVLATTPTPIDVGRVTLPGGVRYFVNVADVGLGAHVVATANRWALPMAGSVAYFLATARALLSHRGFPMELTWEGDLEGGDHGRFLDVAVANGSYFGGGMHIAPRASPTDGLLDVIAIREVGLLRSFALGLALYSGSIGDHPAVRAFRCRKLSITSPHRLLVNLDGEEATHVPATIEILPGVLPFNLPPASKPSRRPATDSEPG